MWGILSSWLPFDPTVPSAQGRAGGLWEKVPVTAAAPAASGFLSQGPHDMNKDTCLTKKEKKKCFTRIYHMLLTVS